MNHVKALFSGKKKARRYLVCNSAPGFFQNVINLRNKIMGVLDLHPTKQFELECSIATTYHVTARMCDSPSRELGISLTTAAKLSCLQLMVPVLGSRLALGRPACMIGSTELE